MFKKQFILYFTAAFSLLTSHAQSAYVNYAVESIHTVDSERKKQVKEELSLMQFGLKYTNQKSYFSQEKHIPKNQYVSDIATIISGYSGESNQIQTTKEAYFADIINNSKFKVDISFKMKDWELTNEQATINNYTCYKAVLKEYNDRTEKYLEVYAWYTPEIPVGYGPLGYGGLPGLILQLERNNFIYKANTIILNPKKIVVDDIPNGEIVSMDEIVRLKRKARKVTKD